MGKYTTRPDDHFTVEREGQPFEALRQEAFDRFDPSILELGNVGAVSNTIEAICGLFDLAGFTSFCGQVDPHLAVPEFMKSFLGWLFDQVKKQSIYETVEGGAIVWTQLPFLAKFMGDGVLFLWDSAQIGDDSGIFNIPVRLAKICDAYRTELLPRIRKRVVNPPHALRCGVARGRVYSIGDGNDFVGPCINIAARLQKVASGITFCFSRRGFDGEKFSGSTKELLLRRISIRGIGNSELVYVPRAEYEALSGDDKALLEEP